MSMHVHTLIRRGVVCSEPMSLHVHMHICMCMHLHTLIGRNVVCSEPMSLQTCLMLPLSPPVSCFPCRLPSRLPR